MSSACDLLGERTRTLVMGVVNVTPDSFSDGGAWFEPQAAVAHGRDLLAARADLLDVGGESTRPGATRPPVGEEMRRVLPVVAALAREGAVVSIDTMRADVAAEALDCGATMINDVSGGIADPGMLPLVAERGVPYVVMHWRGHSADMHTRAVYDNVVTEVCRELAERRDAAVAAGVAPELIAVDPGLGFAKTAEHNWTLLAHLDELAHLGHPVLIGASRKAFLGRLGRTEPEPSAPPLERDDATAATSVLAALVGVWAVRVHDVASTRGALDVVDAVRAHTGEPGVTDRIALAGLAATGYHGVLPAERSAGQRFVVDVVIEADLRRAGASDDLADTVDYAKVAKRVVERIEGEAFQLIERLAEAIAADLMTSALVEAVEVTVHKPRAPVGVPFGDLAVQIRRERGTPFVVAFGANLGDRQATLADAVADLGRLPGLTVRAVSALVETDAVGGPAQPAYLNGILLATTTLSPEQLLVDLHGVEDRHGRERNERWGARALDLDLVQYGVPGTPAERRSSGPDLLLPHPRAAQRAFVLDPWAQVDPSAVLRLGPSPSDPVRAVVDVLAGLDRSGVRAGPSGWSPW